VTIHVVRPTAHRGLSTEELDELYAELPTIDCKQLCQDCCGSIGMASTEFDRIKEYMGFTPHTVEGSDYCPLLKNGDCTCHPVRPTICRLWGVAATMPCPYGCRPSRFLEDVEVYTFLLRSGAYGPPVPAEDAERIARNSVDKAHQVTAGLFV
jgi:hypothetical protein